MQLSPIDFDSFSFRLIVFPHDRTTNQTGCGKTTQVPQLVLDDLTEKGLGGECSIIVTQPRRISAISVSDAFSGSACSTLMSL